MTAHSGWVWGKTPVQSVLKRYCQSTIVGGASVRVRSHGETARFEKGVKISVDKKKHWVDLYHYRVVVYTHYQHTFQFKLLVKVHVALYDPFKPLMFMFFIAKLKPTLEFSFSNVFLFLGHWWRSGGDCDECWSMKRRTFPQTDATVVLKEEAALNNVKDVTYLCCADGASSWLHRLS